MIELRSYQQRCLDHLYAWWVDHPGADQAPLLTVPTGGGKSIIIAELCRLLFDTWPEEHPRTVVLVPSKELAEQNAAELRELLPSHLTLGFYSASLGRKVPDADVIVATIGSIYKDAHLLGNIKCVVIDEAHLVNPNGESAGRYRQFLSDLAKYCEFRVVGCTASPFRGNGVWLTEGDKPLFTGVACTVTVKELLEAGHLAPLVRPIDVIKTRIDTDDIEVVNGDYNIKQLSERVGTYLQSAARESCELAADRKKWIAFCATVENANTFCDLLNAQGIYTVVVCGETPKAERAQYVADFRAGKIRCLVTVLALAVGFNVPDVDCILWLRPTKSPITYVQGAGRGLRIAPGKTNCLWIDFSNTTDLLGPVDSIKGRTKKPKQDREAPHCICPECGEIVRPASALICPSCGAQIREEEVKQAAAPSTAPILSNQIVTKIYTYPVTKVEYRVHQKEGKPDSLRVDYWSGMRLAFSEWCCLNHEGFAGAKAQAWWVQRVPAEARSFMVPSTRQAMDWIEGGFKLKEPASITINETAKFPTLVSYQWESA